MKQSRLLFALAGLLSFPLPAVCQTTLLLSSLAVRSRSLEDWRSGRREDPNIPAEIRDLMQKVELSYLRGSDLLKSGYTPQARAAFNEALDTLFQSRWDVATSPILRPFFQDLIARIQREEALYLRDDQAVEEETEAAVVDELEKLDLIPIRIDPSIQDVVEADILDTRYDIPIVLNETVLKSLNYWIDRGRKYFTDGLMRSGRYLEMIQEVFRAEDLPLDLIYLAQVESLFKTNALSRAYARGIWQFGRPTAIRYGLKVNSQIDERMDPEKSTRAAARYLKDLYGMFQDWNLALAAYNWGEGKVQQLVKRGGTSDFWRLAELKRGFPKETRNHVPLIHSSIILGRNPEKYGLPVELDPPVRYDRVHIPKRTSLSSIGKALGVEVDELKRLNPALKGLHTPSSYPAFQLNIPPGVDPELIPKLALLPAAKPEPVQIADGRYRVRSGDTLWGIASRFGTTVAALQDLNDIPSPRYLKAGRWIELPAKKPASSPASGKSSTGGAKASNPR
ncbi:MAG: LysM peptidoglycan-binding domain-containing protein [Acidobacteria bacterium]|nr:LysM peptidoglycan-binding domain-containing protein [Acidobacteriota bacterium]